MVAARIQQQRVTANGLSATPPGNGVRPRVIRHKDPNPVLHLMVVLFAVTLLIGVVALTNSVENQPKTKRAPAKNIPMIQMVR